jgi:GDP-4-dehydro-6-deoxy-D-mannose reductase
MRSLITGADGFIGSYLVEALLGKGHDVCALAFSANPVLDGLKDRVRLVHGDVLEREPLEKLLREVRPDVVFHLAAQSLPGVSWEKPELTYRVNVLGTVNLLESVRAAGLDPVVVVPGSSSEYAPRSDGKPIPETGEINPSSLYAVSKLAQDHVGRLYHEHHKMRVVRVRPFHLIGPRKTGDMSSDFARGVVAVERGRKADLPVGNLDVVRDLLDVRDGVGAFLCVAERGQAGEVYNICSGRGFSARDVLGLLKDLARAPVHERVDLAKLRPIEEMTKIGDPAKLIALGWQSVHPIRETLKDVLDYWREREL